MQNLSVAVSQSNGAVSITATLNGQVIVNWQGTVGQLAPWAFFHFGRPEVLGVATHQCVVEYHRFALMVASEKTPQGVEPYSCAYKLSDDWLTPITAIKDAPPAKILPLCKLFEGRPYYFSEDSMSFPEAQCLAKQLGGRFTNHFNFL